MKTTQLPRLLWAIALLAPLAFAQSTTATLQGTVTDPNGAAVPRAAVEIKNVVTGAVRTATSTPEGLFRFDGVEPAVYNLTIKAAGFKTFGLDDLDIASNDIGQLGHLKLTLGSVTEQVRVTAPPMPVQPAPPTPVQVYTEDYRWSIPPGCRPLPAMHGQVLWTGKGLVPLHSWICLIQDFQFELPGTVQSDFLN